MGLPHSKTLSRRRGRHCFRQVLECGSPPMPLSSLAHARTTTRTGQYVPYLFVRLGWGEGFAKIRADAAYNDSPVWFRG